MGRRVSTLSDQELARQLVDLMDDEQVEKVLRALAIQHELERRHGQRPARRFVVEEKTRRNAIRKMNKPGYKRTIVASVDGL